MTGDETQPAPVDEADASAAFVGRAIGWILVGAGFIALLAAMVLAIEKFRLIEDPSYVPTCSVDAVLSCGSVMASEQSEAFGFPNPLLGIAGFGALTAFGVALVAGTRFPRWLWLTIQAGVTFAMGFVVWLIFQSTYRIEALCPYCMVVWAMTIVSFVYVTVFNLARGNLAIRAPTIVRYHGVALTLMLLVVVAVIGQAFWDYWQDVLV